MKFIYLLLLIFILPSCKEKKKNSNEKLYQKESQTETYNYPPEAYKDDEKGLIYKKEDIEKDIKVQLALYLIKLKKICKEKDIDFYKITSSQKTVLLDIMYNIGEDRFKNEYIKVLEALKNNDIFEAAKQTYSKDISDKRNQWRYYMFLKD